MIAALDYTGVVFLIFVASYGLHVGNQMRRGESHIRAAMAYLITCLLVVFIILKIAYLLGAFPK